MCAAPVELIWRPVSGETWMSVGLFQVAGRDLRRAANSDVVLAAASVCVDVTATVTALPGEASPARKSSKRIRKDRGKEWTNCLRCFVENVDEPAAHWLC